MTRKTSDSPTQVKFWATPKVLAFWKQMPRMKRSGLLNSLLEQHIDKRKGLKAKETK